MVADVAYLAFTAGYAAGSGPDLLRADVSAEAIRLVRLLRDLLTQHPPGEQGSAATDERARLVIGPAATTTAEPASAASVVVVPGRSSRGYQTQSSTRCSH